VSYEDYSYDLTYSEKMLFVKLWDCGEVTNYIMSPMPGKTEGINGSCMEAFSIGINKYISEDQKKVASTVVEFLTSKEVQKEFIIKNFKLFTGLTELYDDEEVCSIVDCKVAKEIQGVNRKNYEAYKYEHYSTRVENLIYEFLSGKTTAKDVLKKIDDITRIYSLTINLSSSSLIIFILLNAFLLIVILSTLGLFITKLKINFEFLNTDLWMIISTGNCFVLISEMMNYGKLTNLRCYIIHSFQYIGYILVFTPVLYKLISNIPLKNKYLYWIKINRKMFIFIIIFIEIILNGLYVFWPYTTRYIINDYDKNFRKCKFSDIYGKLIYFVQIFSIFIIYLLINICAFLEWNIQETFYGVRNSFIIINIDMLIIVLLSLIRNLNINNINVYYGLHSFMNFLFVITSHMHIFVIRILFNYKSNENDNAIVNKPLYYNNQPQAVNNITTSSSNKAKTNRESVFLKLHYTSSSSN